MLAVLTILHVLICAVLILAVLLQQGKGASMGLLGGAGQAWFGPAGSKTLLMKVTVGFAVAFLFTSMLITLASGSQPGLMAPPPPAAPAQAPAPSGPPPAP